MNKALLIILAAGLINAGNLPDSSKTPGETVPYIMMMELCNKEFLTPQPIPFKTAKKVMINYGIPTTSQNKYVLDYLIPVNLGGSNGEKNLWPQSVIGTWPAYKKDRLEDTLNWMVCNMKITLKDARQIIRNNWITAYKVFVLGDTTYYIYSNSFIKKGKY